MSSGEDTAPWSGSCSCVNTLAGVGVARCGRSRDACTPSPRSALACGCCESGTPRWNEVSRHQQLTVRAVLSPAIPPTRLRWRPAKVSARRQLVVNSSPLAMLPPLAASVRCETRIAGKPTVHRYWSQAHFTFRTSISGMAGKLRVDLKQTPLGAVDCGALQASPCRLHQAGLAPRTASSQPPPPPLRLSRVVDQDSLAPRLPRHAPCRTAGMPRGHKR